MNLEDSNEKIEDEIPDIGYYKLSDSLFQPGSDYKQLIKDMKRITNLLQEKSDEDEPFKAVYELGHPKFLKELKETGGDSDFSIDSDLSGDEDYWNNVEST